VADSLPQPVLLDHVPKLLQALADWLERGGPEPAERFDASATRHAIHRLNRAYDVREMIDEYRVLRSIVQRRALQAGIADPIDVARFHEAIDAAIGEAAYHYAVEREGEVATQQERYRLALDAARVGTWDYYPLEGRLEWDERCRELFAVPADVQTTYSLFLSMLHPADRERVERTVRETLEGGGDLGLLEYRAIGLEDHVERWIAARGRVIASDDQKRATRLTGTAAEVSDQKRQDQAREALLAIVGHDLRNPLNTILFGASLLIRSSGVSDAERRWAERLRRAGDRMTRILDDLTDMMSARLGAGLSIAPERDDMGLICEQLVDDMGAARPDRAIKLCRSGDLAGRWDRGRVLQALGNVVDNALKHGVGDVQVSAGANDGEVVVEVANTGAPIPATDIVTLFKPFRRAPGAKGKGLGLGLFIASEIIQAHGGHIDTRSDDRETVFSLHLPREPKSQRSLSARTLPSEDDFTA
jgi:signal transduction histidine kinase